MGARATDVVVAGGGVIGLSIAWRLSQAGASVAVIDAGAGDGQASIASAGMLAPLAEAERPGPFVSLGLRSLRGYPAFLSALGEESGVPLEASGPGMLRVAASAPEREALAREYAWQRGAGLPLEWLESDAPRILEPALSGRVVAAILSPLERRVEPDALLAALAAACRRRGVRIRAGRARGFAARAGRVSAVETEAEPIPCAVAVLAAGAWSAGLAGLLGAEIPVFPVRGQLLSLRPGRRLLSHTVYSRSGYLVPRAEDRVVVGATAERAGFDAATTPEGEGFLLAAARGLVPSLEGLGRECHWAGLRPGSRDGLPILGRLPGCENVFVATGHFRNGILLAPATAELLAGEILGGPRDCALAAFGAVRWAAAGAA